jgi:creatinine amidohydrolase
MTSLEVEQFVQVSLATRGCVPIIIPVGATEQHGPTGLCGTDILTASAVATEVAAMNDCLLGPNLSIGMSLHHLDFPGSISLRPSTLANVVCDVVHSLVQSSNITHCMFINGHGGNMMALNYAKSLLKEQPLSPWKMQQLLEDNATVPDTPLTTIAGPKVDIISWYANNESQGLAKELYGNELGQHATPDEVGRL